MKRKSKEEPSNVVLLPSIRPPIQAIKVPVARLREGLSGLRSALARYGKSEPMGWQCACIRSASSRLTVTVTDMDLTMTYEVQPAEDPKLTPWGRNMQAWRHNRTDGALLIPFERLQRAALAADEESHLRLERKGDSVHLTYPIGSASAREVFDYKDPKEFVFPPSIPKLVGSFTLSSDVREACITVMHCAGDDETRPILMGVYFDATKSDKHFLVATDGRRMAVSRPFAFQNLKGDFTVPDSKLLEFVVHSQRNWAVEVGEKYIFFRLGRYEAVSRLIEGNYPKWRPIAENPNADPSFTMVFDPATVDEVRKSLKRLPAGGSTGINILADRGGKLWFKRNGATVPSPGCTVRGRGQICLNPDYFSTALVMGFLQFAIHGEVDPLRLYDGNGALMIIMPMRLDKPISRRPPADPPKIAAPTPEPAGV